MKKLYSALLSALENGQNAVLCSILASSGSSPRGAGAKMLVREDGSTLGTIGGGAVERLAGEQALEALRQRRSHTQGFCLAPNQVQDIGMICGGSVTVYYQYYDHENAQQKAFLARVCELLGQDTNAWLVSRMENGAVTSAGVFDDEKGLECTDCLSREALEPLLRARATYVKGEPAYYVEPLVQRGRVYIFGGGHVGQALVPVLAKIGFRVTVYDNRDLSLERFPGADELIQGDYTCVSERVRLGADDYAVIMTPGHQADYEVLEQALRSPATYIGCIGSSHKVARTKERLHEAGFSEENISRLHSPIGLSIGAETPDEIAVSIAAELIAHRAARKHA
ncbi:MAG: XdhC family protein [Eubacteriales bacterium]|nr:XdhC family protein [Eubacteriales bacterium]